MVQHYSDKGVCKITLFQGHGKTANDIKYYHSIVATRIRKVVKLQELHQVR